MVPFMLLSREAQTEVTSNNLRAIRDTLHIGIGTDAADTLTYVDDFLDFIELRELFADAVVSDIKPIADLLRPRVLPGFWLDPAINLYRQQLREHLLHRSPFAYAFKTYLADVITFARYIDSVLPTDYINDLHHSALRDRDENSEYLYEATEIIADLIAHRAALTA